MSIKVSVIVPVYKVQPFLERCIDSILVQTLKEFELILIDDGSPDACGQICDEYAKRDDRIKVIHKENAGVSAARNDGLELARGEYIAFVDSDDYIDSTMLEKMYTHAIEKNAEMSMCDFEYTDGEKRSISKELVRLERYKSLNIMDAFIIMADFQRHVQVTVWNKLFKKELIEDIRFDTNKKMSEDLEFLMKTLLRCKVVVYIPEALYGYYVQREGAATFCGAHDIEWYLLQKEYIYGIMQYVIDKAPDFEKLAIGYRSVNGDLSVANALVRQEKPDMQTIRRVRKDLMRNIIPIMQSKLRVMKKIQILIFILNFKMYTVMMKKVS